MKGPDFPPRLGVEGPEASVIRGADKCQPAPGNDGAAQAGTAGVLLSFGKVVGYTQHRPPGDLAAIHVDRHEFSPRRFVARQVFLGIPEAHRPSERTRIGVTSSLVAHNAHR